MKRIGRVLHGAQARAQFVRFVFTGLFNTLFGFVVFVLLVWAHVPLILAVVLANVAGIALNFQTIGRIVFRTAAWRHLLPFVAVYVSVFLINWAGLTGLVRAGLDPIAAQAVLVLPLAICSFLAHKFLVFERKS